jgi:NAD(P)-dependent dehydrogenase (short-subunit alcohol dehydrogenase family)
VLASKQKKIVTITSQTAAHSYDHLVGHSYASAKAGTNRIMTALATELADKGVTVTLLHPGWVRTEMAGPVADLDPPEAAAANIRVIEGLTTADNGKFLKWTGDVHAW